MPPRARGDKQLVRSCREAASHTVSCGKLPSGHFSPISWFQLSAGLSTLYPVGYNFRGFCKFIKLLGFSLEVAPWQQHGTFAWTLCHVAPPVWCHHVGTREIDTTLVLILLSVWVINCLSPSELIVSLPAESMEVWQGRLITVVVILVAPSATVLLLWESLTMWHTRILTGQILSCFMYHDMLFEPYTCLWAEWGPQFGGG